MTYWKTHQTLREKRGPASEQVCSCGQSAAHWAYLYNDPDPGYDPGKENKPYGHDAFAHYAAMCVECHVRFDMTMDPNVREKRSERGRRLGQEHGGQYPEAHARGGRASQEIHQWRLEVDPEYAASWAETLRRGGSAAGKKRAEDWKNDPFWQKIIRENGHKSTNLTQRRTCDECDKESTPAGISHHQRATGHPGWHTA